MIMVGSAFRDRRFHPIAEHEVPRLKCSVSLLVNYEKASNAFDWEVSDPDHTLIVFHDAWLSFPGMVYKLGYTCSMLRYADS